MKTIALVLSRLFCLLFTLSVALHASQPPAYDGLGAPFVADFNQDGKLDVLAWGTVNLGQGDGTFYPRIGFSNLLYDADNSPFQLRGMADFNGDGNPDVLTQKGCEYGMNCTLSTLRLLLGNGDGTLRTTAISTTAPFFQDVVATDLNGDGKADLVGTFNGMVSVYLSNGDGTFDLAGSYNYGSSTSGVLSLGDFNGDGKTDVVVSTPAIGWTGPGQEFVFLSNGDGTFQSAITTPVGDVSVLYVAGGDFNGDGKLDLAVSGCRTGCADARWLLLGNGDGTFQMPSFLGDATSPNDILGPLAAGDFNGDGKTDLVFQTGQSSNTALIYLGNGDGTFSNGNAFDLGSLGTLPGRESGIAVADFNGDGKQDIAVGNFVLLGHGDGTFEMAVHFGIDLDDSRGAMPVIFVSAGGTAIFDLIVSSSVDFSGTVDLSCNITPVVSPAPACSLSTYSVKLSRGETGPEEVTVTTTAPTAKGAVSPTDFPPGAIPLTWMLLVLASGLIWVQIRKRRPALFAPLMVLILLSWVACGGTISPPSPSDPKTPSPGTPLGTYTVTVTGSSGTQSQSLNLTLFVQ